MFHASVAHSGVKLLKLYRATSCADLLLFQQYKYSNVLVAASTRMVLRVLALS